VYEFREWALNKSLAFPILDKTDFQYRMYEFLTNSKHALQMHPYMGLVRSIDNVTFDVRFVFNSFPTTRYKDVDNTVQRGELWDAWQVGIFSGCACEVLC
jgi:hypothetical protein